jgi:hypothetical protein
VRELNELSGLSVYGVYNPFMEKGSQKAKGTLSRAQLTGDAPIFVPQRQEPEVRKLMSAPGIRTFFNLMTIWNLGPEEQRALLGWPAPSTFYKYKAGEVGTLSYDMLTRISLLLGIYKALHILYPEAELADRWVHLPNSNPLFGGKPALSLMVNEGIDGLYQVRRLLDSRRGTWN